MRRKKIAWSELKVGIFVAVAIALLSIFIIQVSWGKSIFKVFARDTFVARTYLPTVAGLLRGAPVWLAGVEVGRVMSVEMVEPEVYAENRPILEEIARLQQQLEGLEKIHPKSRELKETIADLRDLIRDRKADLRIVKVEMQIDKQYRRRLGADSEVSIESRGLVGDSFIEISVGSVGEPEQLADGTVLIQGARSPGFREIITGANDVVANFGVLSEQIKNIAAKIDPDKVGNTITDIANNLDETLRSANTTFDEATKLVLEARRGDGTIGLFMRDPKLYNALTRSMSNLEETTAKIKSGEGTMSKLINDPALYDRAASSLARVDAVMARIEKGEGFIGKLSKDEALYVQTKEAIDRFSSLVEKMENGNGSLGKLMRDQALYNNLNQMSAELAKLIYDIRQDPKKYLTIKFKLF